MLERIKSLLFCATLRLLTLKNDIKANAKIMSGMVIGLVIDVYLIAYTLPDAVTQLVLGNWSSTGAAVIAFATIIMPIVILAVLVFGFLKMAGVTD